MRRVILESPYAGNVDQNLRYGRLCLRDCLMRGEAPIASHLLLTQPGVLNDADPHERALGLEAGHAWMIGAEAVVAYLDLGMSAGMIAGLNRATACGLIVEMRYLPSGWMLNLWRG